MNVPEAVGVLERDLLDIFGPRLRSLVAYRSPAGRDEVPTLVLVEELSADDLRACADRVAGWHEAGLTTPLLLANREFGRSLDAFPIEFGSILADHVIAYGDNPFENLGIDPSHLRQACEVQARSHLLHLREGYVETRGRSDALANLVQQSAAPLAALINSVARLQGEGRVREATVAAEELERKLGLPDGTFREITRLSSVGPLSSDAARRMFPGYLDGVERLADYIDRWGNP